MLTLSTYAVIAFAADQTSKWLVQSLFVRPVLCRGVLQIRELRHAEQYYRGIFGRTVFVLMWFVAFASAGWLNSSGLWLHAPLALAGVGCALGGAAGNLADILRRHYIVNFIDLGWWPAFNLADVAIVAGLGLAFVAKN